MAQVEPVRSVSRALRILGAFDAGRPELGVTQLADVLAVHPSTASRLASTLAAHGFLERHRGSDAFRLGPEMIRLGFLAAGGDGLLDHARGPMEDLAANTGETVVLSVPSGHDAVDVAQIDTRYLVGGKSWVGRRLPVHATSDGKVFLAFGAAILADDGLARVTPRTITDRTRLARIVEDVRASGWATAVGECERGLNGVAAPVFGAAGRCVAALSVSGPGYRVPARRLPELGRSCVAAAAAVSARLGPVTERSRPPRLDGKQP